MKRWKDKQEFKNRVRQYAKEIDVSVRSLTFRTMHNKWASCSTNGVFHFNDELLELDKKIGIYVIVHELLHLRVPNHGKLWKSLMRCYIKDYENIENKLRKLVIEKQ